MNNNILLAGIGVLVLVVLGGWYFMNANQQTPAPTNTNTVVNQPRTVTHSLALAKRKLSPDIVTVTQGDQVTVKVMSDESGEFHISGYEIENDMTAKTELSFSFTADKAGRYNFELHPKAEGEEDHEAEGSATDTADEESAEEEDIVIGAFVVNPR